MSSPPDMMCFNMINPEAINYIERCVKALKHSSSYKLEDIQATQLNKIPSEADLNEQIKTSCYISSDLKLLKVFQYKDVLPLEQYVDY